MKPTHPIHTLIRKHHLALAFTLAALLSGVEAQPPTPAPLGKPGTTHAFTIDDVDFLLGDQRLQIRCGEIHAARVPRE
jgi:beta-galactosidase